MRHYLDVHPVLEYQYVTALRALFLGVAIVVVGLWLQAHMLLSLVGLSFVAGFWKDRSSRLGLRGAMCFTGVFIAAAGLIALWVKAAL